MAWRYIFHVSRLTVSPQSIGFFGAFVDVGLCCLVVFVCCFLTASRSHQSYQCFALNDRLSCHGAHGMGKKNGHSLDAFDYE